MGERHDDIRDPELHRAASQMRACGCEESEHVGRIVAGSDDHLPRASTVVCGRALHQQAARTWAERLTGHTSSRLVLDGQSTDTLTVPDRPPTAGEVLAHVEAGGDVEWWSFWCQEWQSRSAWCLPMDYVARKARFADPSTPQPGLRLVPLTGEDGTDG